MGSERASTIRKREVGLICCLCDRIIPTPPPPVTRKRYGSRERKCEGCEPRPASIQVNIQRDGAELSVHFLDVDGRTRIGPWFFISRDQLDTILRWGRLPEQEFRDLERDLGRWTASTVHLRLTERERLALIARGRGCPWTGYELRKLRDAGKMPKRAMFREF